MTATTDTVERNGSPAQPMLMAQEGASWDGDCKIVDGLGAAIGCEPGVPLVGGVFFRWTLSRPHSAISRAALWVSAHPRGTAGGRVMSQAAMVQLLAAQSSASSDAAVVAPEMRMHNSAEKPGGLGQYSKRIGSSSHSNRSSILLSTELFVLQGSPKRPFTYPH